MTAAGIGDSAVSSLIAALCFTIFGAAGFIVSSIKAEKTDRGFIFMLCLISGIISGVALVGGAVMTLVLLSQ